MEHRHINVENGEWGVAVIDSIWERGSENDIRELIREAPKNPEVVEAIRKAIPHSRVYGWPRFFKLLLERIDEANERRLLGSVGKTPGGRG